MYQQDNGIYYREVTKLEMVRPGEDKFKVHVNMHYGQNGDGKFCVDYWYFALPHNNNSWIYHLVNHWNRLPGYQYHVEERVV